jgi:hypothetical protein
MVSVCVLVELDLEVGQQYQVERAGGVGLGGGISEGQWCRCAVTAGPTISGRACWWGQQYQVERAGGANNIRSSVLVGPTISGRCNGTAHK